MSTYTVTKTWSYAQGKRFALRAPDGQFRGHYGTRDGAEVQMEHLASRRWP